MMKKAFSITVNRIGNNHVSTMKKILSLIFILTLCAYAVPSFAQEFSFRNNITFEDTEQDVMAKETLTNPEVKHSVNPPWIRYSGVIADIENSLVIYKFDPVTEKLCDVKFDFSDATIPDASTLIKHFDSIYNSITCQYGEPLTQTNEITHPTVGIAVTDYYDVKNLFSLLGGNFSVVKFREWLVAGDEYDVKIDLLGYQMQGTQGNTYSLSMSYHPIRKTDDTTSEQIDNDL